MVMRTRHVGVLAGLGVAAVAVALITYWVGLGRARDAVARLGPALDARDRESRVAAAAELSGFHGRWGSGPIENERARILDRLLDGLEAIDVAVRSQAAEALARWGPDAAGVLRRGLTTTDEQVRIHAAWAISMAPNPDLIPDLRDALQDSCVEVRVYALEALGRMELNRVDEELLSDIVFRIWKDTEGMARNAAAEAMFRLGHATGVPLLVRALEKKFWERFNAYERLTRIYATMGRTLPPYYADGHAARRDEEAARVRAMVFSDPELHRRLIADLAVYKSQIYTATKWALEELGPYVVPALCQAMSDPDKYVRDHSVEVLASLADISTPVSFRVEARPVLMETARPVLRKLLAAPRPDVDEGLYAMRALGNLGVADDIDVLLPHVHGRNPDLAVCALETIAKIGGPAARRALEALEVSGELEVERQRALAGLEAEKK